MTARKLTSVALDAALLMNGCASPQNKEETNARHEEIAAQYHDCITQTPGKEASCSQERLAAWNAMPDAGAISSKSEDSASSGLWWKIPLLVVAVPLLIVGYAYANKDGGGGGRYKGYKTYNSTYSSRYGTTRCRTQLGDGKSYTSCH